MFNNQPHPSVMAWINKGSALQVQHSHFRSQHLAAETLLSAGFCQDQFERGQQLFQALKPEQRNPVHTWVRWFIQSKPNDLNALGMLQDTLFAVEDDGNKLIFDRQGHCIVNHKCPPDQHEFEVYLAEGYTVCGSNTLSSAKVSGADSPLLTVYELTAMLVSAIMLALTDTRLLLDAADRNEVQAPEGSRALVEVGLLSSIKVLWADELILREIRALGISDVFDALSSATPGRYACCFSTHYEDIDEHDSGRYPVSELQSFRLLARDYTLVKPYLDTPPNHWQRWSTETVYQSIGEGVPAGLGEEIEYCDVQLRSGDVLQSVSPCDLNWGVYGRGTIELFRVRQRPYSGLDSQLLQLFEQCLAAFLDRTPFVDITTDYDRSGDWITQIEDKKLGKTVLLVQAVQKSAMHQQAVQRLLFITPN
jgi:hypothetical protein